MDINEMVSEVRKFHEKHDFETDKNSDMAHRMLLMMEEVGELCECITKGKSNIGEELADVLILLLGHCIVLDIDIENEFKKKMARVMARKPITVGENIRVTEFRPN